MVSPGMNLSTRPSEGSSPGEESGQFCWCPPGNFAMGFNGARVTLSRGFWMAKFSVTQEQYGAVMEENPSAFVGAQLPVESVLKAQATEYCVRLTRHERASNRLPENWEYRLPTEAQWEYAARAGTNTTFHWGEDVRQADEYAWHFGNSEFKTHPVGQKKPNPWGLYDTLGNNLEWCQDAWLENYPGGADPEVSKWDLPGRPDESEDPFGVARSSGWYFPPMVSPRVRTRLGSGDCGYLLGFRVAIISPR